MRQKVEVSLRFKAKASSTKTALRRSKCMSVCFSQDPIYFLSTTVFAVQPRCCLGRRCKELVAILYIHCKQFYVIAAKIMTDQKGRRSNK